MIIGMDFSSLEETERKGGKFRVNGVEGDLVKILADHGANAARLRLWLDPYGSDHTPYEGGTCDLGCVERLSRRAMEQGMEVLLDFHYSDFWCDPGRQLIPKGWAGQSLEQLCTSLYDYTARVLDHLDKAGVAPAKVQVGNEITNGMLWPVARLTDESPRQGYDALAALLRAGTSAVRGSSDAQIMLHLENSGNKALWTDWFDNITAREVNFDLIGASYYPYWHGTMEQLEDNLNHCIQRYGKDVYVVETSYPFTTRHYNPNSDTANLCIASGCCADGRPSPYEITPEGQERFLVDLMSLIRRLHGGRGKGLYYWEPGWVPANGTSWASRAALAYCGEEEKSTGNEWSNQCLFDYNGDDLPALQVFKKKV